MAARGHLLPLVSRWPLLGPKIAGNKPWTHCRTFFSYVAEPAHPIPGRKPTVTTAEEAVSVVKSGDNVYLHSIAALPLALIPPLVAHGKKSGLKNVRIHHVMGSGPGEYNDPEVSNIFRSNSFFTADNCRKAINEGRADWTPLFFNEFPKMFSSGIIKPDVTMVQVSPADRHGYHSLGVSVDATRAALMVSKHIIGQVNERMPRTFGDALVHESHFDSLVIGNHELPEVVPRPLTGIEKAIGKYIADDLVEDGATLQMGIGSIPDAVLAELGGHKNLGIHSEMFSDGVVDLVAKGAITNSEKKIETGKITASFCIGTRKLFDFMDDNPFLSMRVGNFVNHEFVIGQNPKVTAINSAIEIDLVGNVSADSIGTRVYSGFGGQVDFLRGAATALDGKGKPILAMPSTTGKGVSKIVAMLPAGSSVTSTRAHVHYVVTEHGIAQLFGKNLRQRAHAMINIAHPGHREALEKAAFERLKCMPSPD